ncbi:tetratricopeptide repeat protein [Azospirillum sp.]|uniref:tetratricopeptide repeat protein n=1 Tax=Azospirillum sp. TaxID=34012 RepID=UPI002D36BD3E|nr:tetratricopeptide repeat protein [Azospirillum sp.]HYD63839.1 tetratricopeptide repeat protein [Azospirillum sp.]
MAFDPLQTARLISKAGQALATGQLAQALGTLTLLLEHAPDNAEARMLAGRVLLRTGRIEAAIAAYRRLIACVPHQATAFANLAQALRRDGAAAEAEVMMDRALRLEPERAELHFNFGNLLRAGARHEAAVHAFQRAVALKPEFAEAWCNLGLCRKDLGRSGHAMAALRHAVAVQPDFADAHTNVAALLVSTERFAEALAAYGDALRLAPAQPAVWRNCGAVLLILDRPEEAADTLCKALTLAPGDGGAWEQLAKARRKTGDAGGSIAAWNRALRLAPDAREPRLALCRLYLDRNRPEEAAAVARDALVRTPDDAPVLTRLAEALCRQSRFVEGERWARRALALDTRDRAAMNCITSALTGQLRFDAAVAWTRRTLARYPDDPWLYANAQAPLVEVRRWREAERLARRALRVAPNQGAFHYGLAMVLKNRGRIDEAMPHYDEGARLTPDAPRGRFNRAVALLAVGRAEEGLPEYEWRWKLPDFPSARQLWPLQSFPQPVWNGEPLNGRTLLVWAEQGIGDEIWDSGYLEPLLRGGTRCVVECDHRLVGLMQRSFPSARVVERTAPPDRAAGTTDVQCAMGGLAWRLGAAGRPVPSGYFKADPDLVRRLCRRYRRTGGPVVGIAWRSLKPIAHRSFAFPLEHWGPVFSLPGITFVSLQYGDVAADLAAVRAMHGVDVLSDPDLDALRSLDALAAQVAACDAVVSIANSTIPMAHAIGRPAFALLRRDQNDWRYDFKGRCSRWLPTVRGFWQEEQDDWDTVVERLASELGTWLSNHPSGAVSPA